MAGVEIFNRENFERMLEDSSNIIFTSPVEFSEYVETVAKKHDKTITQVLLEYCDVNDTEYENLAKMLTSSLKEKVALEMQDAGYLPKTARLEFEFEENHVEED